MISRTVISRFLGFSVLVMVIVGCADAGKHPLKTTDFILAGKDISEHDEAGGVVQASPGIEETDADGVVLSVPADQSLLRFKMFDDPIPSADTNGLLQFVIEYDDIRSIVQEPCGAAFIPDEIELTIEKIEIWKAGDSHRRPWQRWKPGDRMELHPTGKDAKVLIKEGRHFFPIIRGISLPAGAYNRMRVQFSQQGILRDNSEEWPVILNSRFAQYDRLFQTRAGKVTALNAVPSSEFFMGRRSHRWRNGRVAHLRHPDRKRE